MLALPLGSGAREEDERGNHYGLDNSAHSQGRGASPLVSTMPAFRPTGAQA